MILDHRAADRNGISQGDFNTNAAGIADKIRKWAENNHWYEIGLSTNQLRLQHLFGKAVEGIARDLKHHHQYLHRHQLFHCWDELAAVCRQIDMICRAGCRTAEEMTELEFLRSKAVGIAAELSEVIGVIQNGEPPCFEPPALSGREEEWITFAQAAEILAVSKGTVSKWAKAGRLEDNGLKGQKRRLLKTSVLVVKQAEEDALLREDMRELKDDAKRIMNS